MNSMGNAKEQVIAAAEQFARSELEQDSTGHDWWHVYRVVKMAERLAEEEGADIALCKIAALLHDVADEKLNPSKEAGLQKVSDWLHGKPLIEEEQDHIMEIIATMSYSAGKNPPMRTLEGQVVQDADRLDAIGAIAIARVFLYAGWKGDPIHDPMLQPRESMTMEEYRHGKSTAINHFYEKLLKLKDKLNTNAAKRMGGERHRYMEDYLEQFKHEWEGEL
ncbi:HD domain-containing protein [Paenibacillus agilis]|uniref:HD domain-containing protein n=1 Tax=Paenibacillus agilis TaxID=3020863 RepID=A0A559IGP7_9BACL|nr:HD domain-containing protein [Paenibacillus agilis]TVX86804.1 HD domain-containing protein [Paenibacillus agilis]